MEKVTGLPQIKVSFDRDRIAKFGLNIAEINRVIRTAFAGESAGLVFEGERRFDLVVRLDKSSRKDLSDVENLFINTPSGNQILLDQVAEVSFRRRPQSNST